ncbi:endonuclease [Aquisphaera giovannonii]|nr:endonuclease [Aquisphaera giovannonii]
MPLDEGLMRDAEARFRALGSPGAEAVRSPFESLDMRAAPSSAPRAAPSSGGPRARRARELLRTNPAGAMRRRLKRLGIPAGTADEAAGALDRESMPAFESLSPAAAGAGTEEQLGLERIIGRNELLGIQYLDGGQAAARAVARVVLRDGRGNTLGFGTGSLVTPRLLLTNNHVLGDAATARNSIIEFNFQEDVQGRPVPKVRFRLEPDAFFRTSPSSELDFTIVAVAESSEDGASLADFGFNPLGALEGEILAGESVTIIQHPNGEPKQIALRENLVLKFPEEGDRFLHYQTDTTPGSSGSPVYNDQWELVALHHSGFPRRDASGNILAIDGQVWKKEMGEHRVDWIANEGIRARAIVSFLEGLGDLTDGERRLVAPILGGSQGEVARPIASPPLDEPESHSRTTPGSGALPTITAPIAGDAREARWIIPLEVSVVLRAPVPVGGLAAGPASPASPSRPASSLPPATGSTPPSRPSAATGGSRPDDDPVRAARDEARRAASRTYLDESAEAAAKASYYRGFDPASSPDASFKKLGQLLESTHKARPAYAPSRMLYPWVDLQPSLRIKSVYSGQEFDPVELIDMDAEVDRVRAERLEAFRATEAAASPAGLELQEALLEATLPYNCEHVVPQSWFGKREPMRGDLHHLFACESGCNSFRGNTPYFDFRALEEIVRSGCGRREANRFQPTAGLGAVARATLYFLLRYPGAVRRGPTTYTEDRIAMLLAWHKESPVGKYERHRNQAIYEVQGNRNPLIDHPEWAERVDFRGGLG